MEGYGRKTYKNDFIKFLIYAHTSDDETSNHLKKLQILYPQFDKTIIELLKEYDILGAKIYKFKEYVIKSWKT